MVTYIIAAQHGLGRHRQFIEKEDYTTYLKMTFIQALVSTIGSLLFLKLSIGFSLIRMSQQKWYTRVIWGFIGKQIRLSQQPKRLANRSKNTMGPGSSENMR